MQVRGTLQSSGVSLKIQTKNVGIYIHTAIKAKCMKRCVEWISVLLLYNKLVVARGFPRCKPNRIPDKMPEEKMLQNKVSENEKPDKMPDNITRTLTLS